jgi:hypothetical protein
LIRVANVTNFSVNVVVPGQRWGNVRGEAHGHVSNALRQFVGGYRSQILELGSGAAAGIASAACAKIRNNSIGQLLLIKARAEENGAVVCTEAASYAAAGPSLGDGLSRWEINHVIGIIVPGSVVLRLWKVASDDLRQEFSLDLGVVDC